MRRSMSSGSRLLVTAAVLVALTTTAGGPMRASAATIDDPPTRLYMLPNTSGSFDIPTAVASLLVPNGELLFDGSTDNISQDVRTIKITSADNNCDPGDPFVLTGCTAVQLQVGNGTLDFGMSGSWVDDSDSAFFRYVFDNGVVLRDATADDANGTNAVNTTPAAVTALNGEWADINDVLETLKYVPDEDYYYAGNDDEALDIQVIPGDSNTPNDSESVQIRVLYPNDFPELDVPQSVAMVPDPSTDPEVVLGPLPTDFDVDDVDNDEVEDGEDPPGSGDDPDDGVGDEFLLVAWSTCGQFKFQAASGFAMEDDIELLFDYIYDNVYGADSSVPAVDKETLKTAFLEIIPDDVESTPLATDAPNEYTTFFAGVADDITWLNYALDEVTFLAEDPPTTLLTDVTCEVYFLVSDLGYNGLPAQYLGDPPFGLEIPFFGFDLDTNFAPGVEEVVVQIGAGTEIDVTLPTNGTVTEGATSTVPLSITPAEHPAFDVTVFTSAGSGAVAGTDYTAIVSQTVNVPADATTVNVTVDALDDLDFDPGETYMLNVTPPASPPPGYTVTSSDPSAIVTITDTDSPPDPSPTVTINQGATQIDPTSVSPIIFDVVFSEAVTGFATGDVTLGGTAGATTAVVAPVSATEYTVEVSGMTQDGTVTATIAADVATDAGTNGNEASTSTDNSVTYDFDEGDVTDPTVTINQGATQVDPTSMSPIVFDVVFSEPVIGFTGADVLLSGTAGASTAVVSGSGATYTVSVSGMTQDGTVIADIPAGAAEDAAMNPSEAATWTDKQVTYDFDEGDQTPPSVTINQGVGQVDPTSTSPIVFDVVFSEPVTGFTSADVLLSGTAGPTTAMVSGSGATYTVVVSGMSQSGTVVADLVNGAAQDAANNASGDASSTDNSVTYVLPDQTAPSVTINQGAGQADPTSVSPIVFDVLFSEPVTGFIAADVTLSGTAGATTAMVSGSGAAYTVSVSGMTQDGTVIASIPAGAAQDAATNASTASTSTDNTVTFNFDEGDQTPPSVTINQGVAQVDPTSVSPIVFDVVFSEPVVGFANGDVALSGTAAPTAAVVSPVSATQYTVSVSGMSQDGTVIATIPAGAAQDAALLDSTASTSTDNTVTFQFDEGDQTPPSVTINQGAAQADPTSTSPIVFDVVFSEPVTGFAPGDVTLAGTAGATTAVVSGSGTSYAVEITGMTGDGTVIATVAAGVAMDAATNLNSASTSTDNTVTFEIDDGGGQPDPLSITVPADITVLVQPGQPGAVVSYPAPTTTGGVAPVTISCTSQSGAFYPLGVTTVTCTATDSDPQQQGQAFPLAIAADSFTITVLQNQPPAIADNPDITRFTTDDGVVVVFSPPAATDDSGIPPTVTCNPPSGTLFTVGTHVVTCTATDGSGLQATSSFTITVDSSTQLPATGGDMRGLLLMAAGSVLLGALLLRQRRRVRLG